MNLFRWFLFAVLLCPASPIVSAVSADVLPTITVPPVSISRPRAESAFLSVSASGVAPLAYQWYRGPTGDTSAPIAGATGPLLVTPALFATTSFWVRVTDAGGSADSPAATVTIAQPARPWGLGGLGANDYGQLGDTRPAPRSIPTLIATDVAAIAAVTEKTFFLQTDGRLFACGSDFAGYLRSGIEPNQPPAFELATDVVSFSAGVGGLYIVKADASLWTPAADEPGGFEIVATGVASVAAGTAHVLWIKTDGSLWAMGANDGGQLGDGTRTQRLSPIQVATDVISVSAASSHSCFVKADGSLWAMGNNFYGQLGDGTTEDRLSPVQIDNQVGAVTCAGGHTLFLKTDGTLWATGRNELGSLGLGVLEDISTPTQIASAVASVVTGESRTVFVKIDSSLWGMGATFAPELGLSDTAEQLTPRLLRSGVGAAAAGYTHTLFLAPSYTVTFDLGALGTHSGGGDLVQQVIDGGRPVPPAVTVTPGWALAEWDVAIDRVTSDLIVNARYVIPTAPVISVPPTARTITSGSSGFLSVAAAGNAPLTPLVYQWYRGESGDVSSPVPGATGPALVTPALVTTTRYWVRIINQGPSVNSPAATLHVSPADAPAILLTTGGNYAGQLGDGSTTGRIIPIEIATDATRIAAGGDHTLFLRTDGSLWATGNNAMGQLGDGTTTDRVTPVQIALGVISIAAGNSYSLFIKNDGSLWAMGENNFGQLGDGTQTNRLTPVQVTTGVLSVTTGNYHSYFIKADASLWFMGLNGYGPLGYGGVSLTPVKVAEGVASVAAGATHTLFVKTDASLWAAGRNDSGQLGDGTTAIPVQPVRVATDVVAIAAGNQSSLFIKTDTTLWAMGDNGSGQLGIPSVGYIYNAQTPVRIATGVASASIGDACAFFVKNDASLWAMGNNYNGRLGDGTTASHFTPVQILGGMAQASAGRLHSVFLTVASVTPQPFATWANTFGLTASAAVPAADPEADGTPNLLEYAFGTSPVAVDSAASRPSVATGTADGGQPTLVLTHRRRKDAQVTITYQQSVDLADPLAWTPVTQTPGVLDSDADGDGLVELVAVSVPLPTGANPRLFLRVVMTE